MVAENVDFALSSLRASGRIRRAHDCRTHRNCYDIITVTSSRSTCIQWDFVHAQALLVPSAQYW